MKKVIILLLAWLVIVWWLEFPSVQIKPEVGLQANVDKVSIIKSVAELKPEIVPAETEAKVKIQKLECVKYKVCKQIESYVAAKFYLKNLDLDSDGMPCEGTVCPSK